MRSGWGGVGGGAASAEGEEKIGLTTSTSLLVHGGDVTRANPAAVV